ncbi:MAG: hypothetical protein ABJ205_00110 [Erythrobacter sp.]|uniref:hypothetical protein n=1 Tax=Erythrobacter sp. TaxID=1042 RepID=UPI003266FCEA
MILSSLAAALALQAATPVLAKPSSFADLSLEEATAPRCGVAFAIVQGWQVSGDTRGGAWPSMEEVGAREFFLGAIARLMDKYGLERSEVSTLILGETQRHQTDDFARVQAMMPGCLVLLQGT